jgi:purine-nucleoside phosphorylase
MSTVPEVLVARQLEMRVLGLSWITNLATGVSSAKLSHQEVLKQGKSVGEKFKKLLQAILNLPQIRD